MIDELAKAIISREIGKDKIVATFDYENKASLSERTVMYADANRGTTMAGIALTLGTCAAAQSLMGGALAEDVSGLPGKIWQYLANHPQDALKELLFIGGGTFTVFKGAMAFLGYKPEVEAKLRFKYFRWDREDHPVKHVDIGKAGRLQQLLALIENYPHESITIEEKQRDYANIVSRATEAIWDNPEYLGSRRRMSLLLHQAEARKRAPDNEHMPTIRRDHPGLESLVQFMQRRHFNAARLEKAIRLYERCKKQMKDCPFDEEELVNIMELTDDRTLYCHRMPGHAFSAIGLRYGLISPVAPKRACGDALGLNRDGSSRPLILYPLYPDGDGTGERAVQHMHSGVYFGKLEEKAAYNARGGIIIAREKVTDTIGEGAKDEANPLIFIGDGIRKNISETCRAFIVDFEEPERPRFYSRKDETGFAEVKPDERKDEGALELTRRMIEDYEVGWQIRKWTEN